MKYYLVIFDRIRGEVLREEEFTDRNVALKARFTAERSALNADGIEIVILGAESSGALRQTHRRYFETVGQMARSGSADLVGR